MTFPGPGHVARQDGGGVEHWQESAMLSWYDPTSGCGGYHHADLQPGHDRSCLWSWTAAGGAVVGAFQSLTLPLRDGPEVLDPAVGPVRLRTLEPFAVYELGVDHPDGAREDVRFEAVTAPLHGARGRSDYSSAGTGHYELFGRVRGTVTAGGVAREVDGWGFHDHSWGPRVYGAVSVTHRWLTMSFGADRHFSLYSIGTDTDRYTYGFVVADGRTALVRDLDVEVTVGIDGHTPRRCAGSVRDDAGRGYTFTGETHVSSVSTHDGGYFVTDALGEFRCGDRVGSGLLAVRERSSPTADQRASLERFEIRPR